jgi:prepilin-type N-terminal cleavage/methylation domain-containing protein
MRRRAAGFTLIEILAVLAVAGLVITILGQALMVGGRASRVWHGAVDPPEDIAAVELALRHMVERMDPGVWPEPPQIRGGAATIAFSTELPDPSSHGLIAADVRLEASDGALVLLWTPRGHGVPFGTPPPPHLVALLGHVARLELAYAPRGAGPGWHGPGWHGPVWRDRWTEEALPGLVRIRLIPSKAGVAWPPIIARTTREQAEQ